MNLPQVYFPQPDWFTWGAFIIAFKSHSCVSFRPAQADLLIDTHFRCDQATTCAIGELETGKHSKERTLTVARGKTVMSDDAALVAAAKEDYAAFDVLYRRYVTRVYRYCYVQCGNEQDAEDLTAQTFVAAIQSLDRYREQGAFAHWLFSIARRKCHDYHRDRYRHPQETLGEATERANPRAADPERQAYLSAILDCLKRTLSQLTADRQEVVRLRYYAGLSTAETAAVMGKGQSAVKMLLLRALNDLRQKCLEVAE